MVLDRPKMQVCAMVSLNHPNCGCIQPGNSASGVVWVMIVDGGGVGFGVPNHQKLFCSSGF